MFLALPKASQSLEGLLDDGPPGIAQTLRIMREMVKQGKKSMVVRDKTLEVIRGTDDKNWWQQAEACHVFVRDSVQYVKDPTDCELVQTPDATLRLMAGDCDDQATLLCAMLETIGHPTRFVAVGFSPNVFEHVYCETLIGRSWIGCETTEKVDMGWRPPDQIIKARMYG